MPAKSHLVFYGLVIHKKGVRGEAAGAVKPLKSGMEDEVPRSNDMILIRGRVKAVRDIYV